MKSATKEKEWISFLSVISCMAVIFMYVNSCFWDFNADPHSYWPSANIIELLFYFAVPVFFMISGATLVDYRKRYNTKTFFQKRIHKTVVPYVIWTFILLFYYSFVLKTINVSDISLKMIIRSLIYGNGIEGVYWYFPVLFSVYLSIPLFSAVPDEKRKSVFTYLAIGGFILNSLIPFIFSLLSIDSGWPLTIGAIQGYLIFIVIGYLISHYDVKKSYRIIIYILGIAGFIMHTGGTYYVSMRAGEILSTFKGYVNVPCILYSTAIFLFIKQCYKCYKEPRLVTWIVKHIKGYTFSIYLVHRPILQTVLSVFHLNKVLLSYRLIMPFIILAISILFIWIIRKIPYGKVILP